MKILVCNVGSTSLKLKLYEMPESRVLAVCRIERLGSEGDSIFQYINALDGYEICEEKLTVADAGAGIAKFLTCVTDKDHGAVEAVSDIARVGFKATLSKNHFGTHEITQEVLDGMREWLPLATLHNTGYLQAIGRIREALPKALFVGVFETSFHREIPLSRKLYGVPYEWYESYGVQRLGYHSASHGYIADQLNNMFGEKYKALSLHLGGSSSVCAIENGKSIDTSFGMSLQSGLIHATRVGDMDCDLYEFLKSQGLGDEEIHDGFEKKGGLLGISGVSGDVRYLEEAAAGGNNRARLALEVFVNGIAHYAGAFYVDLEGLDVLVFTAGIGENSKLVRKMVCDRLKALGVKLDEEKNKEARGLAQIQSVDSKVKIMVIPTNEELGIARRTYEYGR